MAAPLGTMGAYLGLLVVDSLVRLFMAVVATALLDLLVAMAMVVVDPLVLVYSLVYLGLVVDSCLVGLVDLGLVVDSVDFLAALVVDRPQARPPVAARQAVIKERVMSRHTRRPGEAFPRTDTKKPAGWTSWNSEQGLPQLGNNGRCH